MFLNSAAGSYTFHIYSQINFLVSVFRICSPINVSCVPFHYSCPTFQAPIKSGSFETKSISNFLALDVAVSPVLSLYLNNVCPFVRCPM